MSSTKVLAIASGVGVGGFLFGFYLIRVPTLLDLPTSWTLQCQAALLLGGIGLAGVFPTAWLWATLGMGLAVFLGAGFQCYLDISRLTEPLPIGPVELVLCLIVSFPAPLIGGTIVRLLSRNQIQQSLYFAVMATGRRIGRETIKHVSPPFHTPVAVLGMPV